MKKCLFFLQLIIVPSALCSQTGPAGIGNSSNNIFWLKADKGASSSVNNTPISAWNDQSGNGINVTQTLTAQQPSFVTNVINGFPAILFDNNATANQNDKMLGPDSPILDNTSGYTFFTVTRPQNLNGDARVIVSKRTTVSVDQSFMLFYYTGNKMHVDIQTTDDRFSSTTTFASNNNYLIDVVYNGTLAAASRVNLYVDEFLDKTATESASLVPDNASPIILGTTDATDPRPYGGYMSEVIIYRQALTPAQRIIVNNYLSAKYDLPLTANDKYIGDMPVNGDYDFEVAGVGMESTGGSTSFSPSVSGGLGISTNSGLDNGDYVMIGHKVLSNVQTTTDVGGMTGTNNARWLRTWALDVSNTGPSINVNFEFDMSDGGTPVTPAIASNYVLLYRAGQSGNWSEITTASAIVGDRVLFNNQTLIFSGYITIGTKNYLVSPLPVELVDFNAKLNGTKVDLNWSTATEKNSAFFTVEKTFNGIDFETVLTLEAAGDSRVIKNYSATDLKPYEGVSYYRLKQTDRNGSSAYSPLVAISYNTVSPHIHLYPNPTDGIIHIECQGLPLQTAAVTIADEAGKVVLVKSFSITRDKQTLILDSENKLPKGVYAVSISSGSVSHSQKVVFK